MRPWSDPALLPTLHLAIQDPDPLVRTAGASWLEGFPAAQRLADGATLLRDPIRSVRFAAVRAIAGTRQGLNRDVAAVIKAHNLIDIKTRPRHPESNGIVERFNGTVRDETDNDYGANYFQAEAIIAKLMNHYNEQRLHAALGYMRPATWHRGHPEQLRDQRAGRIAAARAHRKSINQQRLTQAA